MKNYGSFKPLLKQSQNIAEGVTSFATDSTEMPISKNKGYAIAPQKILRCYRLSDLEKLLLSDLFSYMGERKYAYPSHNYLALKLGKKSKSSIKKALNSLQEKGFIYWEQGGGDVGTNKYWVSDLNHNPYIVMSELNHFIIDLLVTIYRNEIPYEKLYGAVLDFIELPESQRNGESDFYGEFIRHLTMYPKDKDSFQFYSLFSDLVVSYLEQKLDRYVLDGWGGYLFDHFIENAKTMIPDEEFLYNFLIRMEQEGKDIGDYRLFPFHHITIIIPDWNYCTYKRRPLEANGEKK
jgi:predicted transcriptional regulator